jgi:lipid IVA palmitoyltransferase
MRSQRWATLVSVALAMWLGAAVPARAAECADLWDWVNKACRRLADTYEEGGNVLLVSGYAWHTPWTWTAEKRAEENEYAWGAGWGRMVERENGDTDTVYALVFSDSHRKPEYNVGYAWSTYWGPRSGIQPGLGYTAAFVARSDIANGWPFPVVLPLFSVRYDKLTLAATYIPNVGGGVNNGSVFYVFGKIALQ